MSNSVFQSVIVQLKDITDRVFGVMDTEGTVVSCTDVTLLGERWPEAAMKIANACGFATVALTAAGNSPMAQEAVYSIEIEGIRTPLSSYQPNLFVPNVIVSGRSVLSRKVMQGTFMMDASSVIPPESVTTALARSTK